MIDELGEEFRIDHLLKMHAELQQEIPNVPDLKKDFESPEMSLLNFVYYVNELKQTNAEDIFS